MKTKKVPETGLSLSLMKKDTLSDNLLDLSGPEASCADLDCCRSTVDHCLDCDDIRSEDSLCCDTDMLTDTTLLLRLSFSGNHVTGHCSFSTNLTSTCHDIFHLNTVSSTTLQSNIRNLSDYSNNVKYLSEHKMHTNTII